MNKKIYRLSKFLSKFLIILIVFFFLVPSALADVDPLFNPNYIISDSEILDYNSMTLEEIEKFLDDRGGYLANYHTLSPEGKEMSAAEIIYNRAVTNLVNPKLLLVLLQKEMSLLDEKNPTQNQLDFAAGYGCPDSGGCNERWRGFWKQINSASLQFRDYMDNPQLYTYRAGNTYTFTNPYTTIKQETIKVTPKNQATASLYNYTPHVYNGNYNFWRLWKMYFSQTYPNGSLLQVEGEPGVWLIQNGKRRPFLTWGAFATRFDKEKIITVNASDIKSYEIGPPIKFPQYSLVSDPDGEIYLLIDDTKRHFETNEAFRRIGYNPEEIIPVSWEDIQAYKDGKPISENSTYPTGALLQDISTGGVYWVMDGEKAPIYDRVFLDTKFKNKTIIPADPEELADYTTVSPVLFGDGELLKSPNNPGVFLISDNKKRPFASGEDFIKLGYKWENIIIVPDKVLNQYPYGEPMKVNKS